jgi:putative ABC transport system permease protein
VLPTVAAIGGTACAVVVLSSLAASVESILPDGTDQVEAMVVSPGSRREELSNVTLQNVGELKAAPGVLQAGGAAVVSPEYVVPLWLDDAETATPRLVQFRGVDPIAFVAHPRVRLTSGRFPQTGEPGMVVGRSLLNRFSGLTEGGSVTLGRTPWPVLGVLESGDVSDSEVWCDRSAIMSAFHHSTVSVVYVRLADVAQRDDFFRHVQRIKGLEPLTVQQFRARLKESKGVNTYVLILTTLSLLLALGATFACTNALHGSFQSRLRELGTLLAVGFRRRVVLLLGLQESLFISACAALIGLPLALLIEGRQFVFGGSLVYTVHVGLPALLNGLIAVATIALLGGILATVQVARMNVLVTLRDA